MSEQTKHIHTPGPWRAHRPSTLNGNWSVYGDCDSSFKHRRDRYKVAETVGASIPSVDVEANARLIAAAPEMLAALKLAIPEIRCLFHQATGVSVEKSDDAAAVRYALNAINAAIAKAEGRKP